MVYGIQNDRTDQAKTMQKEKKKNIYTKLSRHSWDKIITYRRQANVPESNSSKLAIVPLLNITTPPLHIPHPRIVVAWVLVALASSGCSAAQKSCFCCCAVNVDAFNSCCDLSRFI